MSIRLHNIGKHFDAGRQRIQALEPVNLDIHDGELVGLLGPSGSGKTTLLRIIAGLENADPDKGAQILFGDRDVTNVHVRDRRIGFVFQHYALFRHMTVFDNVAFGLTVMPRRDRPTVGEIRARVHRLLEMVQLEQLANRHSAQLSGGQQQRVSLARALALRPEVLLLRPHEVRLVEAPTPDARLPVTVTAISPVGAEVRVELEADWLGEPWLATLRHADYERLDLRRGQRLYAIPRRWHRFPEGRNTRGLTPRASLA